MKTIVAAACALLLSAAAFGQEIPPGFSTYYIGFMTRGDGAVPAGTTAEEIQKGHLAHLTRLFDEGLLLGAGPIADDGELRGLVILRDAPRDDLDRRLAEDPAVRAGRLKVTLKRWMGPADIGAAYRKRHAAKTGTPDKMKRYQIALFKPGTAAASMPPAEVERIHKAHLSNMGDLARNGALIAAGPFLEPGDVAGIYVFAVGADEAAALTASDPAVKAGRYTVEPHPWLVAEGVLPVSFKPPAP